MKIVLKIKNLFDFKEVETFNVKGKNGEALKKTLIHCKIIIFFKCYWIYELLPVIYHDSNYFPFSKKKKMKGSNIP